MLARDTSHRETFAADGTAGEDPCKAQALSGDTDSPTLRRLSPAIWKMR